MTDIDTASIRAEWGGDTYRYPAGVILDLCAALDAARAEPDYVEWEQLRLIAEQGQARAEARIAAALHATNAYLGDCDTFWATRLVEIRHALTEGTGQ